MGLEIAFNIFAPSKTVSRIERTEAEHCYRNCYRTGQHGLQLDLTRQSIKVKLFKQNNASRNEAPQNKTGMIEFQDRCLKPRPPFHMRDFNHIAAARV